MIPPVSIQQLMNARVMPNFHREFANAVMWALRGMNYSVTNWYRSPQHNRAVGGAPRSQHQLGAGVDFVFPRGLENEAVRRLRAQGFTVFNEGDHIHAQAYPAGTLDNVFRSLGL